MACAHRRCAAVHVHGTEIPQIISMGGLDGFVGDPPWLPGASGDVCHWRLYWMARSGSAVASDELLSCQPLRDVLEFADMAAAAAIHAENYTTTDENDGSTTQPVRHDDPETLINGIFSLRDAKTLDGAPDVDMEALAVRRQHATAYCQRHRPLCCLVLVACCQRERHLVRASRITAGSSCGAVTAVAGPYQRSQRRDRPRGP